MVSHTTNDLGRHDGARSAVRFRIVSAQISLFAFIAIDIII